MIQTKQELFAAIAVVLSRSGPPDAQELQQIEALIDDFLADIVQGVCDAMVGAAEADIRSRSGRA